MKLLLHTCCAPCSVSCVKNIRAEGVEPHLFWYNPNIHPYTEYSARRDCLNEFAHNEKLNLTLIDEYGLRFFLYNAALPAMEYPAQLSQSAKENESRCLKCYAIRLEKTAVFAAKEGFDSFTTTLLISPYQNHEAIKQTGEEMSSKYGIEFLYRDFRPLFREGQAAARSKNFYMQKYCGCIFSEEERYTKNIPHRRGEA